MALPPKKRRPEEEADEFGGYRAGPTARYNEVYVNPGATAAPVEEEPKKGGYVAGIKRDLGGALASIARAGQDLDLPTQGLQRFGEDVQAANPAAAPDFDATLRDPLGAIVDTGGELTSQFGQRAAGAWAGANIGKFAGPWGAAAGGVIGAVAPTLLQSYGGQRSGQDEIGVSNPERALGVASGLSALDYFAPVTRTAKRFGLGQMMKGAGEKLLPKVGVDILKEGGQEGFEEFGEEYGTTGGVMGPDWQKRYGFAALKGGLGGAVTSTFENTFGKDKTQDLPEDKVAKAATAAAATPGTGVAPVDPSVARPDWTVDGQPGILPGGEPTDLMNVPSGSDDDWRSRPGALPREQLQLPGAQRRLTGPPEDPSTPGPGPEPNTQRALSGPRSPSAAYREAIASNESGGTPGGGYRTRGPVIKNKKSQYYGEQAAGRYGIMPGNLPEWTKAALGREVGLDEFLASPELQDRVFDHRFGLLVQQFGSVEDAASAWLTGKPLSKAGGVKDPLGTTAPEYVRRFIAALKKGGGAGISENRGGGAGGGSTGGATTAAGGDGQTTLQKIEAMMAGEKGDAKTAKAVAEAVDAGDDAAVDSVLTAQAAKLRADREAFDAAAEANATPTRAQALQALQLDRRERTLAAALETVTRMRVATPAAVDIPAAPDVAMPEPSAVAEPEPNPALAQASEQMAVNGGLDRQAAEAVAPPQLTPEQTEQRSSILKAVIGDKDSTDPRGDFMDALQTDLGTEPTLTKQEDDALKVREGFLRRAARRAQPIAPETEAAAAPAPKPVETPQPTQAAAPTKPTPSPAPAGPEPGPNATIKAKAATHAQDLGLGSVQTDWFNKGVAAGLGEDVQPPAAGEPRKTRNFEKGRAWAERETGAAPEPKAEPKGKTKAARTTAAAQEAIDASFSPERKGRAKTVTPKPPPKAAARAAEEKARAAKPPPAEKTTPPPAAAKAATASKAKETPKPQPKAAKKAAAASKEKAPKPTPSPTPKVVGKPKRRKSEYSGVEYVVQLDDGTHVVMTRDTDQFGTGSPQWNFEDEFGRGPNGAENYEGSLGWNMEVSLEALPSAIARGRARKAGDKVLPLIKRPKPEPEPEPPPIPAEDKARIQLRKDIDNAVGETISAFQAVQLNTLEGRDLPTALIKLAMVQAQKAYAAAKNVAEVGRGDTPDEMLARTLQRVKELEALAKAADEKPQSTANVVPPATPAPGVKLNEGPPITEASQELGKRLLPHEKERLAEVYGQKTFNDATLSRFTGDFVNFVNGVTKGIHSAVLAIAKRIQAVALALAIVFNPAGLTTINNLGSAPVAERTITRMVDIKTKVPAEARAKMSAKAIAVYEAVAHRAMATGKGFMIADKPNGMIHVFAKDGTHIVSGAALYGIQAGDVQTQAIRDTPADKRTKEMKVTPAGTFTTEWVDVYSDPGYRGGGVLMLRDAKTGEYMGGAAVHSVYLSDNDGRQQKIDSPTAADNKVSWGCINAADAVFIEKIVPHRADFERGMVFVLPDVVANTEAMFPTEQQPVTEKVPGKPGTPDQGVDPGLPQGEPLRRQQAERRGRRREGTVRDEDVADPPTVEMTPEELDDHMDRLQAADVELREQLNKLGLRDIYSDVISRVMMDAQYGKNGEKGPNGIYDAGRKLVRLALESSSRRKSGFHEAGHALRDLDLYTPEEWQLMAAYARETGVYAEALANAQARFKNPDLKLVEEEAIVEAFARWADERAGNPPTKVQALFERLKALLTAIRTAFGAQGLTTVGDVYRMTYAGRVGARARGVERQGARDYGGDVFHRDSVFDKHVNYATAGPYARRSNVRRGGAALDISVRELAKKGHLYLTPTEDMANIMVSMGMDAGRRVVEAHSKAHATGRKFEEQVLKTKEKYQSLEEEFQGTKPGSISEFIYDSNHMGKWGFDPDYHYKKDGTTKAEIDPGLQARFEAIKAKNPKAAEVIEEVFKTNHEINQTMRENVITQINADYKAEDDAATTQKQKDDIQKRKDRALRHMSRAFDTKEGVPYSPMARSGWYVVSGKSEAFMQAERDNDQKAIDAMVDDEDHNFLDFRDTAAEAEALASHLETKFPGGTDFFERSKVDGGAVHRDAIFLGLDKMRTAIAGDTDKGSEIAARLNRLVTDVYLHTLSEASARKGELGRKGVPARDPVTGEVMNMMHAFASRGQASANLIASIANGPELNAAIFDMHKQAKTHADRRRAQTMVNEMMYRLVSNANVKPSRTVDRIVRAVSLWTLLSSPFYYLQNFSQAALISLPVLASKYGYRAAWGHLMAGYKDFALLNTDGIMAGLGKRVDFSAHPDPEIRDLLEFLAHRGRLDAGFAAENGHWEVTGDGILPKSWRKVDRFFRMAPQFIEVSNRVATGVAAYRAAIAAGKTPDVAKAEASKLIYDTHGDYSGFNAPTPFHQLGRAGKIMLQFRKFQVIMGSLLGKEFHRAFFKKDATPEEKKQGRLALAFLSAHMAAIGGIMAQPGAALLGPIIGTVMNLIDDDDDKDWSEWQDELRMALGAGGEGAERNFLADFLYKGAPYALLGLDTSDRLGMGNVTALAPYSDINPNSTKEEIMEQVGKFVLGPSGGLLGRAVDGWGFGVEQKDYYRMMETMAPSLVANAMKANRLGSEGLTNAKGDLLEKPETFQGLPALYTALGVRPRELVNQGDRRSKEFKVDKHYDAETASLNRRYTKAAKAGDKAEQREIQNEFLALQQAKKRDGVKPQPLSNLLKAPREQKKRERNTIGGVQATPTNRDLLVRAMFADTPAEAMELSL